MKPKNPLARLWELGHNQQGKLKAAIILAVLGVFCGFVPYFCASKIVVGLLHSSKEFSFYMKWCLIGAGGFILRALLYNFALALSHKGTFCILRDIRQMVLDKLPKLPLGSVMEVSSGRLKQIIVDQVESMETTLAHLFPEMTSNMLVPIFVLVYLFFLDFRMALIALISLPIGMIFMMVTMKGYGKDYKGSVKVTQEMNETIVEYIGGIEVIKAYNQGKNSYAKFADRVNANASYFYNWMKKCQLAMSIAYSLAPTTLITVLPFGYYFYAKGSLSMDTFITIIILSMSLVIPLLEAMGFMDNLAKVGTTVGSVDEFLNAKEQNHPQKCVTLQNQDIKLSDVCFGYTKEKEILHHMNLTIPSGSVTALVGPSGGGKSTIAKLIAGFWDVEKGIISMGGIDIRKIPLEQLYQNVAFVSQDNFLFDDTVINNIRMGRLSATDKDVVDAAKNSGCDEFIKTLEHGYQTVVGSGGTHLSGGEKQRISIARAMLKNAPIVVLDEATAYIDPENEAIIQKAVGKLVVGKTLILIAHRLSTITGADQIVLVNEGEIEAVGTHGELLENSELYKAMWQAHMGSREEELV